MPLVPKTHIYTSNGQQGHLSMFIIGLTTSIGEKTRTRFLEKLESSCVLLLKRLDLTRANVEISFDFEVQNKLFQIVIESFLY